MLSPVATLCRRSPHLSSESTATIQTALGGLDVGLGCWPSCRFENIEGLTLHLNAGDKEAVLNRTKKFKLQSGRLHLQYYECYKLGVGADIPGKNHKRLHRQHCLDLWEMRSKNTPAVTNYHHRGHPKRRKQKSSRQKCHDPMVSVKRSIFGNIAVSLQVFLAEYMGPLFTYLMFYFRLPYIYPPRYAFTSSPLTVVT